MNQPAHASRRCRIALSGGPGAGKTTAADFFRREIGDRVVLVPEAATLLYSGGFARSAEVEARKATQRAIYHVQKNLEDLQSALFGDKILLCDRGTLDGSVYWPGNEEDFFAHMGTSLQTEMSRYDAVVFFESAACGGLGIEQGNPVRNESLAEAVALDTALRSMWARHPNFHVVPHQKSFMAKIDLGLKVLLDIVGRRSIP